MLWYRRRFPAREPGRLLLHFGAVDYRCEVWVNGRSVTSHEGGHTPFSAEIAPQRDNEIVVRVEDPISDLALPRGKQYWKPFSEEIFYTPTSGIWQSVWLEQLREGHVSRLETRPDLATGSVEIEVEAAADRIEVEASLEGSLVASWQGPPGRCRLSLGEVKPWSPEAPVLYDLQVRAGEDVVQSYFGLRSVALEEGRFLLNGRPYVQRLVLDQGYFPGGLLTAGSDAELRRDIELAKQLGFNGARKHQKVEDPRWLFWADRLGFLAWAEMPNAQVYSPDARRRLIAEWRQAVLRDRGRPSVVAWVPLNESWGLQGAGPATRLDFLSELKSITHRLDPSRPVVTNDGWEHPAQGALDTLNDYGGPSELSPRDSSLKSALAAGARPRPAYLPGFAHHGEPVIVSEFGGLRLRGEELVQAYRQEVAALMQRGPVEGFCYTQLADVEQERNGLLTFDRRFKADPPALRAATETPKRR